MDNNEIQVEICPGFEKINFDLHVIMDSAKAERDREKSANRFNKAYKNESIEDKYFTVSYDSNGVNSVCMVKAKDEKSANDTYMKLKGKNYPKINDIKEINKGQADSYKKRGMSCLNEAFTATPWKDKCYEILDELSPEGVKGMAEAFIEWMSDNDVGEFLDKNGYVEYED